MSLFLSKERIRKALVATAVAVAVWAFAAAFQEVLYPLLKGVKWSQAGAKLFIGLGRMFAIYFVKNAIFAVTLGGLPLFLGFLGLLAWRGKPGGSSSPAGNLLAALLLILLLMALLVGAGHFTSLISFKYSGSYVKAIIAVTLGVLAGLFTLGRRRTKD